MHGASGWREGLLTAGTAPSLGGVLLLLVHNGREPKRVSAIRFLGGSGLIGFGYSILFSGGCRFGGGRVIDLGHPVLYLRSSRLCRRTRIGFLDLVTTADNVFWPIGNRDWYSHGEEKSLYDQQPVEASTMAAAALAGLKLRGDDKYLAAFQRAHDWFLGENSMQLPLADVQRGACFDGLEPTGVNHNQGAESTLAYLWTELLTLSDQPPLIVQKAIALAIR